MKALFVDGIWGTFHWMLDSIGRGIVWFLHAGDSPHDDEVYAMTGGGTVGAIFGSWIGFMLSTQSSGVSSVAGAIIGGTVGGCTGVFCGAIVQIVDDYIDALLNSLDSQRTTGAHDNFDRGLIHRP